MKQTLQSIFLFTALILSTYSVASAYGDGAPATVAGTVATNVAPASDLQPVSADMSFPQQGNDDALNSVIFYPNPVKDNLTVRFPKRGTYTVTIFNILGDKVVDKSVVDETEVKFNLSELQNGVFFLSYEFNGKVVTKRFSKTN
jgi:hypothetical protein